MKSVIILCLLIFSTHILSGQNGKITFFNGTTKNFNEIKETWAGCSTHSGWLGPNICIEYQYNGVIIPWKKIKKFEIVTPGGFNDDGCLTNVKVHVMTKSGIDVEYVQQTLCAFRVVVFNELTNEYGEQTFSFFHNGKLIIKMIEIF